MQIFSFIHLLKQTLLNNFYVPGLEELAIVQLWKTNSENNCSTMPLVKLKYYIQGYCDGTKERFTVMVTLNLGTDG